MRNLELNTRGGPFVRRLVSHFPDLQKLFASNSVQAALVKAEKKKTDVVSTSKETGAKVDVVSQGDVEVTPPFDVLSITDENQPKSSKYFFCIDDTMLESKQDDAVPLTPTSTAV